MANVNFITFKELNYKFDRVDFNKFYLLLSKDYYRVYSIIKKFKNILNNELNFTSIDIEKVQSAKEIINCCETYPFLDAHRVIYINNIDFKKHEAIIKELLKYIPKMSNRTILLISHYITDKRENYKKNTTALKFEKSLPGCVVYQPTINLEDLKIIAAEENINLKDNKILNSLLNSDNLDVARNDLIKLSYLDSLDDEKIKRNLSSSNEIDIFNLTEAIQQKNIENAIAYIFNLQDCGENEIKLNMMILKTFKLLYDCKTFVEYGMSEEQISQKLHIHPYPVKIACNQSKLFSIEVLKESIDACLQFDINFKKGAKGSLEILLLKILSI